MLYGTYFIFLLIGLTLGLIGAGGSILTIPVLVYIYNLDPFISTTYSLFIIGTTSIIGVVSKLRMGQVDSKTAIMFVIPSILTVSFVRSIVIPVIPDSILQIDGYVLSKSTSLMLIFAALMILVASRMLNSASDKIRDTNWEIRYKKIIYLGGLTGVLTGFVGAGGGFIIVPALALYAGMSMKKAIGTSLLIIALNAFVGFFTDLCFSDVVIDWGFLVKIILITLVGVLLGNRAALKIDEQKLKMIFGWFVLVLGCIILLKEMINLFV